MPTLAGILRVAPAKNTEIVKEVPTTAGRINIDRLTAVNAVRGTLVRSPRTPPYLNVTDTASLNGAKLSPINAATVERLASRAGVDSEACIC